MAHLFHKRIATTKNGKRISKKSKYWYAKYKDENGRWKEKRLSTDSTASQQLLAEIIRKVELADAGIYDRYESDRKMPLEEHLAEFKENLLNQGCTEKHSKQTYNRAKSVIDGCKFAFINNIKPSYVEQFIADKKRQGLSIQTCNFYLKAIKQFCKWLVKDQRTGENLIQHLQCQNVKLDRRHDRRAMSVEEVERLLMATQNGSKHHGLTSKERTALYMLALSTGLRAAELGSLTWSSFNLSESEQSVTVEAAYSKHRREDVLPLRPDMALFLNDWKTQRQEPGDSKLFPKLNSHHTARMLRKDLEGAGIEYEDETGRFADFHSLRHTFITNLVQGGVNPRVAQSLARHSTITLTMDRYSHVNLVNERTALDVLPGLTEIENEQVLLKTGTDCLPVSTKKTATKSTQTAPKSSQIAYFGSQRKSANISVIKSDERKEGGCKPFGNKEIGTDKQLLSVPSISGG